MNFIIFSLLLFTSTQFDVCFSDLNFMQFEFREEFKNKTCGQIMHWPHVHNIISCSTECCNQNYCTSIFFNVNTNVSEKCKLISGHSKVSIDKDKWQGYKHFIKRPETACNNIGIPLKSSWRSACPILYFPLDSNRSAILGGTVSNVEFLPSGKINGAISLPYTVGSDAFYNLGTYPEADYCFPDPMKCPNGVSVAFWLKIPVVPTNYAGYITTALHHGPGIYIYYDNSDNGLRFMIRRYEDRQQIYILIKENDFMLEYGFGSWVHYVATYRYILHTL